MNNVTLLGRLTRDASVRTYGDANDKKMARFVIACDRRGKKEEGQQTADFIGCICYGKQADFADQYLRQGTKIALTGEIRTGSYDDKDGKKVYTTDVLVHNIEFAESKRSQEQTQTQTASAAPNPSTANAPADDSFMDIPRDIEAQLPWN